MNQPPSKDEFSPEETARRRDDALRRALTSRWQPHKAEPKPFNARAEAQRRRREREKAEKDAPPSIVKPSARRRTSS